MILADRNWPIELADRTGRWNWPMELAGNAGPWCLPVMPTGGAGEDRGRRANGGALGPEAQRPYGGESGGACARWCRSNRPL